MKARTVLLLSALTLAGCKRDPDPLYMPEGNHMPPVATPTDPAKAGTITGVVHFEGKPPARIPIDMSMDPACNLGAGTNLTEQYIVNQGGLANVYVYVKYGLPLSSAFPSQPPVVLDQRGCRYTPHVIVVQQGGSVEFRNSDPTMHNVHTLPDKAGNASVDLSETPLGQPQTEVFKTPEAMLPVRCNNHPWMQAFINVAPNPSFAVTDANGHFTLPDLPPGTYTLAAVHEKLGEQDIQITVAPKATAQASFTFNAQQPPH